MLSAHRHCGRPARGHPTERAFKMSIDRLPKSSAAPGNTSRRLLPDSDYELTKLILEHGQAEVARMYGVTRAAVSDAVRKRKLPVQPRRNYKKYIPWTISIEDERYAHPVKMLRLYAKEQEGEKLTEPQRRQLDKFKAKMDAEDLVVHYDPEHPDGPWLFPRRREGVDTGYVRNPEVP